MRSVLQQTVIEKLLSSLQNFFVEKALQDFAKKTTYFLTVPILLYFWNIWFLMMKVHIYIYNAFDDRLYNFSNFFYDL